MMKKLLPMVLVLFTIISCKENSNDSYDFAKQAQIDDKLITEFLTKNNLTAQKHQSGLYYIVSNPGTGNVQYAANTTVTVKYALRLLNGTTIPQTTEPISFQLGGVIAGWQYGVPLIQKGGKIRLIIPSGLAYGPRAQNGIPANSVLDFDIELLDVK
ncbi:FKBP-type peptidyl-prolyl cis-trans isomerase [Rubrolithibacter danxiaensis]|uniref:FKBP-type peptidyl-prolyl cis-trans isomerase n=1 Tax=Rubrolithibacter danxiaensis TaxID=3390805 RepID=UPI003BF82C70